MRTPCNNSRRNYGALKVTDVVGALIALVATTAAITWLSVRPDPPKTVKAKPVIVEKIVKVPEVRTQIEYVEVPDTSQAKHFETILAQSENTNAMVKAIGRKVLALEKKQRLQCSRWHDYFPEAWAAANRTGRPLVVVVGVEDCQACEELVLNLKKDDSYPFEFIYILNTEKGLDGNTVAQTLDLPTDSVYPVLIGVWDEFRIPLSKDFFDD